jgi:hypothetical protein
MQPIEIRKIVVRKEPFTRPLGGRLLLRENHHKINLIAGEDLLLNEGVIPLSWTTSCTTSLSRSIPD